MNLLGTDYNGCLEMRSFSFTSSAFTFLLEYLARRDCRGAELTSETDLGGRRPPRPPSATWLCGAIDLIVVSLEKYSQLVLSKSDVIRFLFLSVSECTSTRQFA